MNKEKEINKILNSWQEGNKAIGKGFLRLGEIWDCLDKSEQDALWCSAIDFLEHMAQNCKLIKDGISEPCIESETERKDEYIS